MGKSYSGFRAAVFVAVLGSPFALWTWRHGDSDLFVLSAMALGTALFLGLANIAVEDD